VGNAFFGVAPLPVSYLARLESIPAVKRASFCDGLAGTKRMRGSDWLVVGNFDMGGTQAFSWRCPVR
jgi:hypothetical protein